MATETQESAKLAQLAHENPDEIEVAAGREREQLEGWIPALASDAEVRLGLSALLVRPDGFVAWASDTTPGPEEVARAAARWFASRSAHSDDLGSIP